MSDRNPRQEQHHFIVVALIGLSYALAPIMLVMGAIDSWLRDVPATIAFEILMYVWIMWMYRSRERLSTAAASGHFVAMMLSIGVITGWWYINDPVPFLFLITAIPIAGILLGVRGFLASSLVAAVGLVFLGVAHGMRHSEVFDNHYWVSTSISCLVIGTILGGAASRLNEALRAVPDPVTIRDFRRERELETQLALAERDRALGALARAVAHDFNNLLTPIMASAELASMSVDDPEVREDLSAIMLAGREARSLVRTVLEFQRDDSPVRTFDIGAVVEGTLTLIKYNQVPGISYQHTVERGIIVRARASDIQRMVMNLVTNAQAAVGDNGTISISVGAPTNLPKSPQQVLGQRSDDRSYACIDVEDDGVGMSAENLQTVFAPFVTHSAGTGLGLSTVEEIMRQLDGQILVWSEVGEGTRFRLLLPLA